MEIAIHRSVGQKKSLGSQPHRHIVGFRGFFEDDDYIYILLELKYKYSHRLRRIHENQRYDDDYIYILLELCRRRVCKTLGGSCGSYNLVRVTYLKNIFTYHRDFQDLLNFFFLVLETVRSAAHP